MNLGRLGSESRLTPNPVVFSTCCTRRIIAKIERGHSSLTVLSPRSHYHITITVSHLALLSLVNAVALLPRIK